MMGNYCKNLADNNETQNQNFKSVKFIMSETFSVFHLKTD
jgi:hypothetical protein